MSYPIEDRVIALAGIYQCAALVHQIAVQGKLDNLLLEQSLQTLFVENPSSTLAVYADDLAHLDLGLRYLLANQGDKSLSQIPNIEITKYVVALMVLSKKVMDDGEVSQGVFRGIERAHQQVGHFGLIHENVLSSLAKTYSDIISQLTPKVLVRGAHGHLQNPKNANKIRALLLAGIRSAVLWRQVGGSRWQLLFQRSAILNEAKRLHKTIPAHRMQQISDTQDTNEPTIQ